MPVRSLNSSVLKWPDAQTVERSLRRWVKKAVQQHPSVVRAGYLVQNQQTFLVSPAGFKMKCLEKDAEKR